MKSLSYLLLLFCLSITFIISCNNKKADSKQEVKGENRHTIVVNYIGEMRTRRTYADIQFMHDQKEIDKYLKRQEASNPYLENTFDSTSKYLATQFERLGLIKNDELFLQKFKKQTAERTIYVDSSGKKISLFFFISILTSNFHFRLLSAADSVEIDTGATNMQDLDYAFLDVISGGNKELVFLDDFYLMNGDNFDFKVYEIKIN